MNNCCTRQVILNNMQHLLNLSVYSDETTDTTTSHLTNPAKNAGQVIGYSHSTKRANNARKVAGYVFSVA